MLAVYTEHVRKQLKTTWGNSLPLFLNGKNWTELCSVFSVLIATIEIDRVGIRSQQWTACLPAADITKILKKIGDEYLHSFRDLGTVQLERLHRLLSSALRLYQLHQKSLEAHTYKILFEALQKGIQESQNQKEVEYLIERGNIMFLLRYCQNLLASIDNGLSITSRVASGFAQDSIRESSSIQQSYEEIKEYSERVREIPDWHLLYMEANDACSVLFVRYAVMQGLGATPSDHGNSNDEYILSLLLYDHIKKDRSRPTTKTFSLRRLGTSAVKYAKNNETVDLFRYGILDLMYQLSFRVPEDMMHKCFECFVKTVRTVLENSHSSDTILQSKAVDLWNQVNSLAKGNKIYGRLDDHDRIRRSLRLGNIDKAGNNKFSKRFVFD